MFLDVLERYVDARDDYVIFSEPTLGSGGRARPKCPEMSGNLKSWISGHFRTFSDNLSPWKQAIRDFRSVQVVTYLSKHA